MPSFLVAVNFWKCVVVDSCYLRVFYEEDYGSETTEESSCNNGLHSSSKNTEKFPFFQWESRHARLFKENIELGDKINVQHIPYVVCAFCCIAIFWCSLISSSSYTATTSEITCHYLTLYIVSKIIMIDVVSVAIGAIVTAICVIIFWKNWTLNG